ncbi:MAG: hypothetical protein Q4E91_06240 [Lachnospiraceae bacterium]|nr:hypothetical protein [Lachnospiraceae bacterium]
MGLRYINAIMAGILFFLTAMAAGWILTDMDFLEIMFLALCAYWLGIVVSLCLTKPRKKQQRTRWELQVYDLRKEGWDEK